MGVLLWCEEFSLQKPTAFILQWPFVTEHCPRGLGTFSLAVSGGYLQILLSLPDLQHGSNVLSLGAAEGVSLDSLERHPSVGGQSMHA